MGKQAHFAELETEAHVTESLSSRHTAGRDGGSRGSLGLPSTIPCPDPTSMIPACEALCPGLQTQPGPERKF